MHQQVLLPVGRAPNYRIKMSVALHLDMRTFFFLCLIFMTKPITIYLLL